MFVNYRTNLNGVEAQPCQPILPGIELNICISHPDTGNDSARCNSNSGKMYIKIVFIVFRFSLNESTFHETASNNQETAFNNLETVPNIQ